MLRSMRPLSQSSLVAYPRKDSQDRDSINTDATEYSKSGSDDAAAKQTEAAYDPSTTDPEKEKDVAGGGNEVSEQKDVCVSYPIQRNGGCAMRVQ
jgi:hypothetical protein